MDTVEPEKPRLCRILADQGGCRPERAIRPAGRPIGRIGGDLGDMPAGSAATVRDRTAGPAGPHDEPVEKTSWLRPGQPNMRLVPSGRRHQPDRKDATLNHTPRPPASGP